MVKGVTVHNINADKDNAIPSQLPKNDSNIAPVKPIKAATSNCSIIKILARLTGLSIIKPISGFSIG